MLDGPSDYAGPFESAVLADLDSGAPFDYDALMQVYEKENVLPWGQSDLAATVRAAMENLALSPSYVPGTQDCVKASGSGVAAVAGDMKLVQTSTGYALAGIGTAGAIAGGTFGLAAATVVIPIIGPIIAGIIGLFTYIFEHHAKQVEKEQNTLCAAVPAANNYINIIRQAVADGTVTPAAGIAALNSLAHDFEGVVGSIRKMDTTTCNAACEMWQQLKAIVEVLSAEWEYVSQPPPAPAPENAPIAVAASDGTAVVASAPVESSIDESSVSSGVSGTVPPGAAPASSSLPGWALPAAAAVLLWMAFK